MIILLLFVITFTAILAFLWGQPMPPMIKIGFAMIAQAFAMILEGGIYWGLAKLRDVYYEICATQKANCLIWRHPDNTKSGIATLELESILSKTELETISVIMQKQLSSKLHFLHWGFLRAEIKKIDALIKNNKSISGPDWFYKYLFFMPEKRLKWVYEEKQEDGKTYKLMPYAPDKEIQRLKKLIESNQNKDKQRTLPTTGELANSLDWRPALRRLRKKKSLADTLATGAAIAMPIICVIAIMFLLDMLKSKP